MIYLLLSILASTIIFINFKLFERFKINIPKGTQSGAVFSIPNNGIPDMQRGIRGNLFVEINAIVPKIENEMILKELERIKNAID